jgi:hypothetical protein
LSRLSPALPLRPCRRIRPFQLSGLYGPKERLRRSVRHPLRKTGAVEPTRAPARTSGLPSPRPGCSRG